jgi:hypothetical protein
MKGASIMHMVMWELFFGGENINKVLESAMGYPPTDSAVNRGFDSHTLHNLYNVLRLIEYRHKL